MLLIRYCVFNGLNYVHIILFLKRFFELGERPAKLSHLKCHFILNLKIINAAISISTFLNRELVVGAMFYERVYDRDFMYVLPINIVDE